MERALITKVKLPDASGVMSAYVVAEDEFGTWFFTPATSPIRWTNIEKSPAWEFDVLYLIPPNDWFFALWWGPHPYEVEMSVDITAPVVRTDGNWSWTDLEIDLARLKDGTVVIEDEDEFEVSCNAGWISEYERAEALRITPIIETMLRERIEPFGEVGARRLEECVALGLAPLEPPAL